MEGTAESQTPDLRDLEGKVGRKTPEGLLRGLRGEWEPGTSGAVLLSGAPSTGHSLGDKIMALRMELVSVGCTGRGGDESPAWGRKGWTRVPRVGLGRRELKPPALLLRIPARSIFNPWGPLIAFPTKGEWSADSGWEVQDLVSFFFLPNNWEGRCEGWEALRT